MVGTVIKHNSYLTRDTDTSEGADALMPSYTHKLRFLGEGGIVEVPVSFKAFISIHGISKKKLMSQKSFKMSDI